ncbi:MAG: type II toxin-antitoxin system prevent-host-death family antitoxin [Acidimicrobiia bacterium]|jgi:prevent-host-death family protein|nr:type II toxin-antitoxin system prevent-host-death family antitoxin [Acidimicrobiia bacterium]
MSDVPSRELRNDTRGVLTRVENGEEVTITVDGRPIATLRPLERRTRWMRRDEFVTRFAGRQADAALTDDLARLVPETTDDVELR